MTEKREAGSIRAGDLSSESLEARIDYIRAQIRTGEYGGPAREATQIIETAFRELYRRSIGLLEGRERMRVYKAEEEIGGGAKSVDEFTMGQLVALFRNTNFLEAWSKATNNELRGIRMINLDEIVRLRNQLAHTNTQTSRGEAELLFQCLQAILETFGILSLERVTSELSGPAVLNNTETPMTPTTPTLERGARRGSNYSPRHTGEASRLAIQARHARAFDDRLLQAAMKHVGNEHLTVVDIGSADGVVTRSRFSEACFARVIGIDRDGDCIAKASTGDPDDTRFEYRQADIESLDFDEVLGRMIEPSNQAPNMFYSSLTLHHLANPIRLLRTCRYRLGSPGAIVLRGSDDGMKVAYPDPEGRMARVIDSTMASPGVSDRLNGRKLYHQLYRAGFRNINMYYDVQDTANLTQEERRDLYIEGFGWRRNYLMTALAQLPQSELLREELNTLDELLSEFEFDFEDSGFYYAELGFGAVALVG